MSEALCIFVLWCEKYSITAHRNLACSCVFPSQTIQKVLVAYAELVRKDFPNYTGKHTVVCILPRHYHYYNMFYNN